MAALLVLTGPQAGRRHEVVGEVIIGRSPSCTISLEDAKVSRRHVRLALEDGEAKVSDLGSRNGTVVNGEKIEGELVLLPGDRLQVGDSTIVFEPTARAALADEPVAPGTAAPIEELLPAAGSEAALFNAGVALLSATSEAMILRRAAEELGRSVSADRAAALLGGVDGLITAAVFGAEKIEVPRSLVRAALERKEATISDGRLAAPVSAAGGAPFGVLYAERPEPFGAAAQATITALGRLAGEACTAMRARQDEPARQVQLVGSSKPFRKMIEQARRAAAGQDPVAIWGEFGSGRLSLARFIHARSSRALGPFVVVDCRRVPAHVEDALFGKTSAPGVPPTSSALLDADGGTLVLRQLEALPRHMADRLARLLARKVAPSRQGGEEPVDVRVITTGDAPLQPLVVRGDLDADLARELGRFELETVPLRERRADVLLLVEHFASLAAQARRKEPPVLTPDAKRLLVDYGWPLNVEELRGVTERLALLYAGSEVSALVLPPELQTGAPQTPMTLAERIQKLERDAIAEALRSAKGKKIKAAAILGISRPTLDKKIDDYQLVVEKRRG